MSCTDAFDDACCGGGHFAFDPEALHMRLIRAAPRKLGFKGAPMPPDWPATLRAKIVELLRMPEEPGTPPRISWLGEALDRGDHTERRLVFEAEPGADVPCVLLLPKGADRPLPIMLCLQGHTTGMHISLAVARHDHDDEHIAGDRDFALQAVRRGFAALALEQRAFGIREDARAPENRRTAGLPRNDDNRTCKHAAMTALLVGRTLLGERVFDVRRACDAVALIDGLDAQNIHIIGNSGGGTVAWYAAAVEPRLKGAILASCFATVATSIGAIDHCTDNYLPGMLEWFDFPDMAGAVEAAKILVVTGRHDDVFPYAGVVEAGEKSSEIFASQGRPQDIRVIFGEGGHRFYQEPAWSIFLEMMSMPPIGPAG